MLDAATSSRLGVPAPSSLSTYLTCPFSLRENRISARVSVTFSIRGAPTKEGASVSGVASVAKETLVN